RFFPTDVPCRLDLVPIREEFFGPKLPASTLITTPALAHPDYLIEIEAVAFVEGRLCVFRARSRSSPARPGASGSPSPSGSSRKAPASRWQTGSPPGAGHGAGASGA